MTSLMAKLCFERCNVVTNYKLKFIINSLQLSNEEDFEDVEKTVAITWDGYVFRSRAKEFSMAGWCEETQLHCTPLQLNQKLKSSAIMLNLMAGDDDLGIVKFALTKCFCDAILCSDFNSQVLKKELKFLQNDEETAIMDIEFKIEKMESQDSIIIESLEEKTTQSESLSSTSAQSTEFPCTDELSEECKKNLALDEHFYRIINGHLINVKDKRGYCGNICDAAIEYCKEIENSSSQPKKTSSSDLLKLFRKKNDDFKFDCSFMMEKEDLSKEIKVCKKQLQVPKKRKSLKKKKNVKKFKKSSRLSKCKSAPELQKTLIEDTKSEAINRYSYDFGNSYPFHRSGCVVQKICESVPSNMGWRHDKIQLNNEKWHPGKINKTVRILMKHYLKSYPKDTIALSSASRKMRIDGSSLSVCDENELKSTLHVLQRNGEIFIEMRPLKGRKQLMTGCQPYLNCTPLKFVIRKQPEEIKKHKARVMMKSRGFIKKCNCRDIKCCRCISHSQKLLIQDELKKISAELKMKKEMQYEDIYELSDSEIDFEFTPPTVLNAMQHFKPDVTHTETQYDFRSILKRVKC